MMNRDWSFELRSARGLELLAGLLLLVATGCGKEAGPPHMMERPPATVVAVTAVARDVPVYLDEIGRSAAREIVTIQPQLAGRITQIHFSDGADLKRGDLLFTIDPRPYQAALDQAEASLVQCKAVLDLARVESTRYQNALKAGGISHEEVDQKKSAVEVAAAQAGSAAAAIETAKLNLEYCTIRSPIDGRAGQRLADVGNVVKANETPLLVIARLDPIYADFTVAESNLLQVQRHMRKGGLKAAVRLPDDPADVRTGDLTFLDTSVQEGTGTIKLRATLPNADFHIWPGRFVKVRLILDTLRAAVLVPSEAIQISGKGSFVYVVKADSTAELRPVTPGQRHEDLVVIRDGVAAGERIITVGQLAVMPGGKVRLESQPTSKDATAPHDAKASPPRTEPKPATGTGEAEK